MDVKKLVMVTLVGMLALASLGAGSYLYWNHSEFIRSLKMFIGQNYRIVGQCQGVKRELVTVTGGQFLLVSEDDNYSFVRRDSGETLTCELSNIQASLMIPFIEKVEPIKSLIPQEVLELRNKIIVATGFCEIDSKTTTLEREVVNVVSVTSRGKTIILEGNTSIQGELKEIKCSTEKVQFSVITLDDSLKLKRIKQPKKRKRLTKDYAFVSGSCKAILVDSKGNRKTQVVNLVDQEVRVIDYKADISNEFQKLSASIILGEKNPNHGRYIECDYNKNKFKAKFKALN